MICSYACLDANLNYKHTVSQSKQAAGETVFSYDQPVHNICLDLNLNYQQNVSQSKPTAASAPSLGSPCDSTVDEPQLSFTLGNVLSKK